VGVFKKQSVYWIDYYVSGHRKRERIGPDKRLAETVLKKRKVEIAEGKFLDRQRPVTTTFDELADADYTYVVHQQRKRSWPRDRASIRALTAYFGGKRLTEITPALIEQYRAWRREGVSRRGRSLTPTSVNRELACLKRMFTVVIKGLLVLKGGVPRENPGAPVSLERENNERDRVLSDTEFQALMNAASAYFKPILLTAYHTGMRKGEILNLTWDRVDLKAGLVRLRPEDTKAREGRTIPLTKELSETLRNATIYLDESGQRVPWVFTHAGKRILSVRRAFETACREAGLNDVVFHDLRHTFVTNMRRAGVDYFRIMAITGHKTMTVFKRYNTIDGADLRQAISQMDTHLDTTRVERGPQLSQTIENK
jgi:integrase